MKYIGKICGKSNIYLETVYDYCITDNTYYNIIVYILHIFSANYKRSVNYRFSRIEDLIGLKILNT